MTIIKCGGSILDRFSCDFIDFIATWQRQEDLIIVHGGGPTITNMEKKLNLKSNFNSQGQRITNQETLEVVLQCLCGSVNSQLVSLLSAHGIAAFGISGQDGGLLQARLKDYRQLGWVGEIVEVKAEILQQLCRQGFLPVVAPVSLYRPSTDGSDPAEVSAGQLLNVNADDAASAIASAVKAQSMIFVSDIPGILNADKNLLPDVSTDQIKKLIADGVIYGGMIPKVEGAIAALCDKENVLEKVFIVDGTSDSLMQGLDEQTNLAEQLANGNVKGTCIHL